MRSNVASWFQVFVLDHTEVLGVVACRVHCMPIGIGSAERNWNHYKLVKDKGKGRLGSDKAEKKVLIYGNAHMFDPDDQATADKTSNVFLNWVDEKEVLHFNEEEDDVAIVQPPRKFSNFIEAWEPEAIKDRTSSSEFKLLHKYMGVRFTDEDEEVKASFVISESNLEWASGKRGGWKVIALMLDDDGLTQKGDEDTVEGYFINEELHSMIKAAEQKSVKLVDKA